MSQGAHAPVVLDEERTCPECGGQRLVRDAVRGEVVCDTCGLVLQDLAIDTGPEWSAYSSEEADRRAHNGAPRDPLRGSTGLTTVISPLPRDARGNPVRGPEQRMYDRLRRLQRRAAYSGPGERALPDVVRVLNRLASALDLPKTVREEAAFLCRKVLDHHLLRGRSTETVVACAVYAACRIDGVPRTLEELEAVTGIPRKTLGRVYRTIRRKIGVVVPAPQPEEYVRRFCSVLGLTNAVEAEALRLLRAFDGTTDAQALSPAGTTAAAVYLAARSCGEPRAQEAVARVSGISEVTLRNRYKAVLRKVGHPPSGGHEDPDRADTDAIPTGGSARGRALGKARGTVANREAAFGPSDPGT